MDNLQEPSHVTEIVAFFRELEPALECFHARLFGGLEPLSGQLNPFFVDTRGHVRTRLGLLPIPPDLSRGHPVLGSSRFVPHRRGISQDAGFVLSAALVH